MEISLSEKRTRALEFEQNLRKNNIVSMLSTLICMIVVLPIFIMTCYAMYVLNIPIVINAFISMTVMFITELIILKYTRKIIFR